VRQVTGGEVNAFESLVKRHAGFASAIVKRHVPFDDVEDTFHEKEFQKEAGEILILLAGLYVTTQYDGVQHSQGRAGIDAKTSVGCLREGTMSTWKPDGGEQRGLMS
jgi:hypothetical protein